MIKAILQNIPALIVALPIFIAPILAMIPTNKVVGRIIVWQISYIAYALAMMGSIYLFVVVYQTGPLTYFFGSWSPPTGIEYEATKLNTLLLVLISSIAFALMPFAWNAVEAEISHKKTGIFYAVFMLLVAGLMGMVITNDIFNIYVFLEISSLATYALVALGNDKRALTASYNYLIVGTIGGTLFLAGIGFLYALTGSLNISDIAYQLGLLPHNKLEIAALVFVFIGLAIKGGIVPFAGWLPRVYAYSPSLVAAFVSAVSTKVALYILAKVLYVLFGKELGLEHFAFGTMLVILAVIGIIFGALAAIMQTDIRKMLAFSSISNIGYIVLGIGLGYKTAMTGAIILFIAHALAVSGLFIITGLAVNNLRGLKNASPLLAGFAVLFGLSLVGTPLTMGFIPKWYLLVGAAELHGLWRIFVFGGIISGTVLSAVYVWKIIEQVYANEPREFKIKWMSLESLFLLAAVTLFFGIYASPLAGFVLDLSGEFAK